MSNSREIPADVKKPGDEGYVSLISDPLADRVANEIARLFGFDISEKIDEASAITTEGEGV